MDSFHEVRFPPGVAFGATSGPERLNEIVLMSSGRERRNARLAGSRRRYDAGTGVRSADDLYDVLAFFEARRGSLIGFRFRDPFDMKSCRPAETPSPLDQPIGVGDGIRRGFNLVKLYGEGPDAYARLIAKPVSATVRIAVAGAEQADPDDFSVDHATGAVTFTEGSTPAPGAPITAGYIFDVPVRFDADQLSASLTAFRAGQIPTVPLREILP